MLKIYINNEEVIANQNFTIQKHMLNTPSVILNNVCPKTWCDEKDYITNFYHPLDYSKCKIVDETFHPYDPGITTTINQSATLNNVDTTKLYELTKIEGNTTQSGTPTPTTPQPINVVSGRQDIITCGKNLFDFNDTYYTQRSGQITINGSTISVSTNYSYNDYIWFNIPVGENKQITISYADLVEETTDVNNRIQYFSNPTQITENVVDYISISNYINKTNKKATFTTTGKYLIIVFRVASKNRSYTISNVQVEKGNTATTYEAYKGQSYEINLGKNLFNINDFFSKYQSITIENNSIILGNVVYQPIVYVLRVENNKNYTISFNSSTTNVYRLQVKDSDSSGTSGTILLNKSITSLSYSENFTTTSEYIRIEFFQSTSTETQIISNIQLEKGNTATSYSPYKTPIELCEIGDYKDRIYKDNGTWYIEKQVGKQTDYSTITIGRNGQTTNYNQFYIVVDEKEYGTNNFICDKFSINQSMSAPYQMWGRTNSHNIVFNLAPTDCDYTINVIRTWLQTNQPIFYYQLATPTTTEITDTELISQLNSIELLEGLNNISITSGDLPGIMTIHYNFKEAYTTEDLLFCGVVKNSGKISLNPREPHYTTLQVLDFKDFLSSGETLDFVIYQKTILEAIQQVIGTIQDYGFILGNVNILNPNEIIGAYSTKDKTAYDVFNYIADITQSRWTTRMIDENTVAIDFYDPTLMPHGTEIDYTNAYFNDKLIDDMKYSYGTNNYRNKQVMISKQVYSNISQTQTIVANGYQTQFPTEQPIGKINSITSNGIPLTFATFNEKDMGYVADFYYNPGENYFESDDLRSTGEVLIIDYVAIVEGRQVITNSTEIDRINESTGRKGIIARYETRNDATTSTELQKIGESYIKYKGTPEIVLTIQSRKSTWEVGQRVQFNAPIDELDTEYMVRSKKINYIANQQENESQLFYTYELISSFNSETEINYFDNQRAKTSGNIGEGEYISRNIDIESTAEIIFYDTDTTEVQVSGDNELNAILNSPFIS